MFERLRLFNVAAMQMSRSVINPTTLPSSVTTGSTPQSFSHINPAASASVAVGVQAVALLVIISLTFITILPFAAEIFVLPQTGNVYAAWSMTGNGEN